MSSSVSPYLSLPRSRDKKEQLDISAVISHLSLQAKEDKDIQPILAQVYKEVDGAFRDKIYDSTGSGGCAGHLQLGSAQTLFAALDASLRERKYEWKDQHLIDVGMGKGHVFYAAAAMGCRFVSGIDFSIEELKQSQCVAKKLKTSLGLQSSLAWGYGDIRHVTNRGQDPKLEGVSIVYAFSSVFHIRARWALLQMFAYTSTTHTLVAPKTSISMTCTEVLKPAHNKTWYVTQKDKKLANAYQRDLLQCPSIPTVMSGGGFHPTFTILTRELLDDGFVSSPIHNGPFQPTSFATYPCWFGIDTDPEDVSNAIKAVQSIKAQLDVPEIENKDGDEPPDEDDE
jgi:hypothetical protein